MTVIFEDKTTSAGLQWTGLSNTLSTSWVDFNNDSFPDLWIGPELYDASTTRQPQLYLNQGNGSFTNITSQITNPIDGDGHGTVWADYDNDGDQDLAILVGGKGTTRPAPSFLFVNENGVLVNRAQQLGVELVDGDGKMPIWWDQNTDGKLDLVHVNGIRPDGIAPSTLFRQGTNGFTDVNSLVGLSVTNASASSAQVTDLFGNGKQDILFFGEGRGPVKVYENGPNGLTDITASVPTANYVRDAVVADFNNDLVPDIFLARALSDITASQLVQDSPRLALARLQPTGGGEVGATFQTGGSITFDFHRGNNPNLTDIYIGSQRVNPTSRTFTLSPNDPNVLGTPARAASGGGLYITYNPATQTWKVDFAATSQRRDVNVILEATQDLTNLTPVNFQEPGFDAQSVSPALLMYNRATNTYVNQTQSAGLSAPLTANSVVYGDFDNDMDVDLYVSSAGLYETRPSTFYQNQGNGTFVAVANAAGAAGSMFGPRHEEYNAGISIATADYDKDGFLDLYVANTGITGFSKNYMGSPPQLFRNVGNGNRWLEIDLQGVQSNRDGIGAKVFVTTPDGVTQLREHNNGIHRFGQSSQRLHFGLAGNTQVQKVAVHWPNGTVQELTNVSSNQILKIVEDGTSPNPDPDPTPTPTPIDGTAGNDTLSGTANADTLRGFAGNDTVSGLAGSDVLLGGDGNDSLNGGDGNDSLDGGLGNDSLDGGVGTNTLTGGAGDDVYFVNSAGDSVIEAAGEGTDTIRAQVSWTLGDNQENLVLLGTAGNSGTGNGANNTLTGNTGANTLSGLEGNDTILAGRGNDAVVGGVGNDSLLGEGGNDTITGGLGNDTITSSSGIDFISFASASEAADTMTDFSTVNDTILVSASGFGGGLTAGGAILAAEFRSGAGATTATAATQRFIYNNTTGVLLFDADGSDAASSPVLLATLTNRPSLTIADIVVTA